MCNGSYQIILQYGGELWWVQTLVKWQRKHHWQNKLWQFHDASLIKHIEFKYTTTPLSSVVHVCMLVEWCQMAPWMAVLVFL